VSLARDDDDPPGASDGAEPLLTLEQLSERVGMSVRNVRFYTSRGLVPSPLRRGRAGYYSADHVARLELVQELQSHGFTLAAIERYVARIPPDAAPEDIALQRAMLAPWHAEAPLTLSRADLERRAGRPLSDDELTVLETLGVATPDGTGYSVAVSQLSIALGLVDLGYPVAAALAAKRIYAEHGRAIAEELYEVFRSEVWPHYRESGASSEVVQEVVERLKPLSIASLVAAYEEGMDATRRANIAKRSR
jgi:DNA-binding transcriptional MerR regulator